MVFLAEIMVTMENVGSVSQRSFQNMICVCLQYTLNYNTTLIVILKVIYTLKSIYAAGTITSDQQTNQGVEFLKQSFASQI